MPIFRFSNAKTRLIALIPRVTTLKTTVWVPLDRGIIWGRTKLDVKINRSLYLGLIPQSWDRLVRAYRQSVRSRIKSHLLADVKANVTIARSTSRGAIGRCNRSGIALDVAFYRAQFRNLGCSVDFLLVHIHLPFSRRTNQITVKSVLVHLPCT